MPNTHCLPSGSLGTKEIPVCNISAAINTVQDPGAGNRRGVIVSIGGLSNAYVTIPNPIPNSGTTGFYSRYGDLANAVQTDGWIFLQPPLHEVFCTNNVGYGSTAIYNDIANDAAFGARFLASTLHWWDHVVAFIHSTYGATIPIVVFGASLGGLKALIVAANRSVLGYMAHIPATIVENIASNFAAPNNFGLLNCSGLSLNATYMNAVTVPGFIGYGTADEAVGWAATTVAAGSAGINVTTFTGSQSLSIASVTNIVVSGAISPNVLLTGLTGGIGRAVLSFTGNSGNTLTGCTLLSGTGTTVSGAPCVQGYTDQIITNALGVSQPVTRYVTNDLHEFTGTPTAASGTASSGTMSTSSSTLTMTGTTAAFPTSGTIVLTHASVKRYIAYTGISGSTFTGCTIPTGSFTVTNGDAVIGGSDAAIYAAWVAGTLDPLAPANTF